MILVLHGSGAGLDIRRNQWGSNLALPSHQAMAATTADLETLYNKIMNETTARFDKGVGNATNITEAMKEIIEGTIDGLKSVIINIDNWLKNDLVALEGRLRNEFGQEVDRGIDLAIRP